jgi:ubiquinone/menaquinone biosynthesis C-methylase UbiE
VRERQRKPLKRQAGLPTKRDAIQGESWEHVAAWYDSLAGELGTEFQQEVVIPGVLRLLELRRGEKALDLACGQGAVSRALHKAGAQVTGVDLSPRLIEMARQRSPKAIRYIVSDARHVESLADGSFDVIVFVLAAQNIEAIEPVFAECARLLRPGGRLVMVTTHPAFRIPRQSGWKYDEERRLLFRAVDRYLTPLKIPIDMKPFKRPGRRLTWTYHRPMQAYVNGLAAAGLWVNALEEWPSHRVSQPGPMAKAENRARAEFPLFLALRAVSVAPKTEHEG